MTKYAFIPSALPALDALQTEAVAIPFFEDERPLQAAAGLIDWRLCGSASRRQRSGELSGTFGAQTWMLGLRGLMAERLLWFGLGPSDAFTPTVAEAACLQLGVTLRHAGIASAALSLPGRSLDRLSPSEALQRWLSVEALELDELTLIDRRDAQGELQSVLEGIRRREASLLP